MAEETSTQAQPAKEQAPSRVVYVEELASPEDYWLSITSAARVVRRQDITIRRWIASGMLPLRGDPAKAGQPGAPRPSGLNKRTRYVRASDLEQLSPIVDPSAVIIGDEGRLDLPSIPAEQAAIKIAHQQLLGEITDLRQQVHTHTHTFQVALAEQRVEWQGRLEAFNTAVAAQIVQMERAAETRFRQLESLDTDHQGQLDRLGETQRQHHESLTGRIDEGQRQMEMLRTEVTEHLEHLAATLQTHQQEMQRSRQDWEQATALQNKALVDLQQALERVEQRGEELAHQQQEALRTATTVNKRLEQLEERLGRVATAAQAAQSSVEGYQKRAEAQDRQIEELRRLLQQEVEARQALAGQEKRQPPPHAQQKKERR
ncbi:MAG: hypothetical protein ACRDIV_17970 [Ktedonobacteraceae bacterium]